MALDVSICLPYTAVRIAALRTAVSLPGDLALKPLPQNAVSDLQRPQILCIGDTKVKLEPIRPPPEQASVDHGLWVRPCPDKSCYRSIPPGQLHPAEIPYREPLIRR